MIPYYDEDGITIYHGDCRDIDAWDIAGGVMVTDPPYGISWKRSANPARASKAHSGIVNDHDTTVRDDILDRWGERPACVFGSFYAPFPARVKHLLVWEKPLDAGVVGSTLGYRRDVEAVFLTGLWPLKPVRQGSVLRANGRAERWTDHPHTKPVDLMQTLVLACPPLAVIVDPFMGSGSTLVAAKRVGRSAIGIEIEERYCEIAAKRLAQGVLDFGSAS